MKKLLLVIAVALVIFIAFSLWGSDSTTIETTTETTDTIEETSSYTRAQAETLLGISLPEDTVIDVIIDNDLAVGVLGSTALTIDDAQAFMEAEMETGAYSISRGWGVLPTDNEDLHTATYTGSGETWAIILRNEDGKTTLDLQRQF